MTSTSRKLRKLDKIFFKCKNTCEKECLRIAELNAENLFLKIRECSWRFRAGAAVMLTWQHYLYDGSGQLMAIRYKGADYYYIRDGLMTITGLVDANGAAVVNYRYDSWGMTDWESQAAWQRHLVRTTRTDLRGTIMMKRRGCTI